MGNRLIIASLVLFLGVCSVAGAGMGAEEFSSMLSSKSISEVLPLVQAARKDHDSASLKSFALTLKRVMRLQSYFDHEKNPQLLWKSGASLRAFYYQHLMLSSALANDRKLYQSLPGDESLSKLLETLVLLNRDREALGLCSKIGLQSTARSLLLYGALAYARGGQVEASHGLLARVSEESCTAPELYIYLQVASANGEPRVAARILRKILVNAPPEEMAGLRLQFASQEFSKVSGSPEYQEALQTESKAPKGMGQCPNSGTIRCGGKD